MTARASERRAWIRRSDWGAWGLGLFGLLAARFSIDVETDTGVHITFEWPLVVAVLAALAYGRRGALIAGFLGGAVFTPLVLWRNNGWANIGAVFVFTLWLVGHGWMSELRAKRATWWNHPLAVQPVIGLAYVVSVLVLYPPMLALNTPPRTTFMPQELLIAICTKSFVLLFACTTVATTWLTAAPIRRLLGLAPAPHGAHNAPIVAGAMGLALVVWTAGLALDAIYDPHFLLPMFERSFRNEELLFLLVLFAGMHIAALVLVEAAERLTANTATIARSLAEQERVEQLLRDANTDLERKVDERTAALTQANAELESFTRSVSHDLRAPLRVIDGFAQVILVDHKSALPAEASNALDQILRASQRAGALIDDLLRLAKTAREDLVLTDVDVSAIATEILEAKKRAEPSRVVRTVVAPRLHTKADEALLRVVLENLLGNAWKYTSKKAEATIELGEIGDTFFVRDDGCGFDMARVGEMFTEFARLHEGSYDGHGIGLAIVKRVIAKHQGTIEARGEIDGGAEFRFRMAPRDDSN